jgi:hypothetical protein
MAASEGSVLGRIGEYFTLSAAKATQAKLGEPARKAMDRALTLGRQRADAAESLWSNGHTAEALRLALRSLDDTLAAVPEYAKAMGTTAAPAKAKAPKEAERAEGENAEGDKAEEAQNAEGEKPEKAEGEKAEKAEGDGAKAEGEKAEADGAKAEAEGVKAEAEGDKSEGEKSEAATAEGTTSEKAQTEGEKADAPKAEGEKARAEAGDAPAEGDWSSALLARGGTSAHVDKIRAALAAAKKASLPVLDADVSAAHADLFQQVLDARHLIDRAFGPIALAPRDLGWTRFSRIGTTSVIGVLVLGGLYFGLRTPEGVFADASDVWAQSPMFAPENVIDGNDDSYWLLPDGATGWVEARISPPVDVHRIRLLNTHNPPHNDRASREYAVEIYSGGELAQTVEGSFEFSPRPEFVSHDVSVSRVDRIRFVARSHHHVGAGLAELQWE